MSKMYWIKIKEEIFKITKKDFKDIIKTENDKTLNKNLEKFVIIKMEYIRNNYNPIKNTNKYVFPLENLNKIYNNYLEEQKNRSNY